MIKMLRFLPIIFCFFISVFSATLLAVENEAEETSELSVENSQTESEEYKKISKIKIIGTSTLSEDAVNNVLTIRTGEIPTKSIIRNNVKHLIDTGYFSDVSIAQNSDGVLVVTLKEKPTLREIEYEGFNVVDPANFKDKILTKPYSILDERKILKDLNTIEQEYIEKGYYLAKPDYVLSVTEQGNTSNLIFTVKENAPVTVRKVNILGNEYFSDAEIQAFMMTRPKTWLAFLNSSGVFRDEFLEADQNNITYIFRDNGFAEATVAPPYAILDKTKSNVDVSFYIEQGERFKIGKINFGGDLLVNEEELRSKLTLKEDDYYKISKFTADMSILKNFYGDKGYAFAYVYPSFDIDRKNKTYEVTYHITPGTKAYFRKIEITGNLKTRDNVIRRALKISEGQLFNSTDLERSKSEIEYTGYFAKAELLDSADSNSGFVDVKFIVEEKSTGQFRASIGASPSSFGGGDVRFFADLNYQERNLLGKGYALSTNVQISPSQDKKGKLNYSFGLDFLNPSIYNSPWNFGISGSYNYQLQSITQTSAANPIDIFIKQKSILAGASIGREIFDHLRLVFGYNYSQYFITPSIPLTQDYYQNGATEEVTQELVYDITDDASLPTSGFYGSILNAFGVRWTMGDYNYGTVTANFAYYLPIYFTRDFKTNFRFVFIPRYVYKTTRLQNVPYWKRFTLGSMYYMKGYTKQGETITPTVPVTISPVTGQTINMYTGGNRSFYGAVEYFIPLIPEVGLRFVAFAEAGTVLDDTDLLRLSNVKTDVGFGVRWTTSVAPFRFEWAFPVQKGGKLGESHFVFTVGLDGSNM